MSSMKPMNQPQRNMTAIGGVAAGAIAIVLTLLSGGTGLLLGLGLIVSVVALVISLRAFSSGRKMGDARGRTWGIVGLIIGAVSLLVAVFMLGQPG